MVQMFGKLFSLGHPRQDRSRPVSLPQGEYGNTTEDPLPQ